MLAAALADRRVADHRSAVAQDRAAAVTLSWKTPSRAIWFSVAFVE